jgi:hypothetical protein
MTINFSTLATTALGFTVALAWNNAVSQSLKSFYPPQNEKAAARHTLIYAAVITLLVLALVAAINGTRKLVYRHTRDRDGDGGDGGDGRGPSRDTMRGRPAAATAPLVRLWEPPRRGRPR